MLILVSVTTHSQILGRQISKSDSIPLTIFWRKFKRSVDEKDEVSFQSVFKFLFYCSPCIDCIKTKDSLLATVKITKQLFRQSIFKLFYDLPILNKTNKKLWTDNVCYCIPLSEGHHEKGFTIPYAIVEPSESGKN